MTYKRTISQLYSIEPIGIGTGEVESIVSYLLRLAATHCVNVGDLYREIIRPLMDGMYGKSPLLLQTSEILSCGEVAKRLVNVLGLLTRKESLHLLTMRPFDGLFNQNGMFKRTKAWCPFCFTEQGVNRFEQLYWALDGVDCCIRHKTKLVDKCPQCASVIPHVSFSIRIGYCPKCLCSLASYKNESSCIEDEHVWISENVVDLLKCLTLVPELSLLTASSAVANTINIREQSSASFAKIVGYNKATVWYWYNGKSEMSFGHLLRVCCILNVPIMDFLQGKNTSLLVPSIMEKKPVNPKRSLNQEEIRGILEENLSKPEGLSITVTAIAKEVGVATRILYRNHGDICKKITEKYRKHKSKQVEENKQCIQNKVREIVFGLLAKNIYPSARQVRYLLPQKLGFKNPIVIAAWRDTLNTAGLSKEDKVST